MSKKFQEISEFSEFSKICEFCNNKSRYHDFPSNGTVTCGCENPKNIHDECLFNKIDSTKEYYYFKKIELKCEICNSKLMLNGTFYTYHKVNGLLSSERNYKDSILDGIYKEYDYNGESLIKELFYKNGKIEGFCRFWNRNKNGILYLEVEENYVNGMLDGLSIIYDEDGCIIEKNLYKENDIIKRFNID